MKLPIYDQRLRFDIFKLAHDIEEADYDRKYKDGCEPDFVTMEGIEAVANRIAEFVSPEVPDQDPPDYVNTPEELS